MDTAAQTLPATASVDNPYARWADIFARAHNDTHSIATALEVLDAIREHERLSPPPVDNEVDRILAIAASLFSVPLKRLRERSQRQDVTSARYVAAMLLRRRRWTTTKIGDLFGLDHSTIVGGIQKVENTPHLFVAAAKAEQLLSLDGAGETPISAIGQRR